MFATERFADLTRRVATSFSLPDVRAVVVPHPLGGTDEPTITSWADAAVERVVGLLQG